MKIGFIGVGNLGEKAVTKLSKDYDLFLSDPIEKDELKKVTNGYFSLEETINSSDVIFFTIKPNMIGELFSKNDFNLQDKTFISFMAGLSLDKIHALIGEKTNLIRGCQLLVLEQETVPLPLHQTFPYLKRLRICFPILAQ